MGGRARKKNQNFQPPYLIMEVMNFSPKYLEMLEKFALNNHMCCRELMLHCFCNNPN